MLFDGYRVSVWNDKRLMEMASGDLCIASYMNLISLNYALKRVKMVNLHVHFTIIRINGWMDGWVDRWMGR